MFEHYISHHIQKHIISTLAYVESARFSELRPPKTDTNLFSYHLGLLVKNKFVSKREKRYELSLLGLMYIDRVSMDSVAVRHQPKIITMLLVQNGEGEVLVQKRNKQPYINSWTLPYGKLHDDDASLEAAAMREAEEKLNLKNQAMRHAGDCYIRVRSGDKILSTTMAHVFRFETEAITQNESLRWVEPLSLMKMQTAPAVEEIIARSFFGDTHFFDEFDVEWPLES